MGFMSWRRVGVAVFIAASTISSVQAQEVASSIEQLRVLVRPGSEVNVTDATGRQLKGTVEGIDSAALRLRVHGIDQVLQEPEIRIVRQRRDDPLTNGARNGFISGAAFGVLTGLAAAGEDPGYAGIYVPVAVAVYGASGTAIGVGSDALIRNDDVIFDSGWKRPSRASVAPIVGHGRKGLQLTLARW